MAIARTRQASGCEHGPGCPHDIGPAAAGVSSAANAIAAADRVVGSWSQQGGSGPVERRVLTADELAARVTAGQALREPRHRPSEGMHVMRPASRSAQESTRPSGRVGAVAPARAEAPAPHPVTVPEEEPVVTTEPAPPAIPCGDCLHARVCGKRETIEGLAGPEVIEHAPGLRLVITRTAECDDYLAPTFEQRALEARVVALVPDPEPIRAEHGGESWRTKPESATPQESRRRGTEAMLEARKAKKAGSTGLGRGENNRRLPADPAERERVVLEAVRATETTAEAGERLGVTATRVQQILRDLRDQGRLPADIAATIAARRAGGRIPVPPQAATA